MTTRTVSVALMMKVTDYVAKAQVAKKATSELMRSIDKLGKESPEKFNRLTMGMGALGLGMVGVAGFATKLSMDFDKAMSAASAATHATSGDLDQLREAALKAGAATSFSATEAAQGVTELGKAGVSTAAILGGGLKGALDLAAAGQLSVSESAEIAASAMTQFKLSSAQLPHVADLLAAGAGKAQGSVHDLGMALNMSGLVASQFGLSVEDTVGALAAFASAGLTGSDAGTSFKQSLLQLGAPSEKAIKLMQELGISAYDTSGRFVGISALAGQLQTKLGGLTQAQRDSALATIFGSDAIRVANVLYQQGEAGVQRWAKAVNDSGYASDTAARLTDNLAGDLERLRGSLETLAIQSGSGTNSGLRVVTKGVEGLVNQVSQLPGPLQSGVVLMTGLTGATILGAAGFLKARQTIGETVKTLTEMGPVGAKAGQGLQMATKWAGRAAAAFVALEAAGAIVSSFGSEVNPQIQALSDSLADYGKTGKLAGEATRVLGKDLGHLDTIYQTIDQGFWTDLGNGIAGFTESITGTGGTVDDSLQHTKERISAIDQALTSLVQSGRLSDATAAFQRLADEGKTHGVSVRELNQALPGYTAAIGQATKKTDLAAQAAVEAANKGQMLKQSLYDQVAAGKELSDIFETLNGQSLKWAHAQDDLEAAYDDATKAIKENGATLDVHTEKGRANRKALEDLAEKTAAAVQARYDDTKSLQEAVTVYEDGRQAFITAAIAMGKTRTEAEKLADAWLSMPTNVTTSVAAPGLTTVLDQARNVEHTLDRLDGKKATARVTLLVQEQHREDARQSNRRWGGITEHALNGGVYEKAAAGTLREASVYSAVNPGRYMISEPGTRGEAFIPKSGNYARSMSILGKAASWYGAMVMPANYGVRGGAVSAPPVQVNVTISAGPYAPNDLMRAIMTSLRTNIDINGGNVQRSLGRGRR